MSCSSKITRLNQDHDLIIVLILFQGSLFSEIVCLEDSIHGLQHPFV